MNLNVECQSEIAIGNRCFSPVRSTGVDDLPPLPDAFRYRILYFFENLKRKGDGIIIYHPLVLSC